MKFHPPEYQEFLINGGYWIDGERRLRLEVYHGRTGLWTMRGTMLAMAEDSGWSHSYHGLTDLRDATLELGVNEVIRLGLLMRQLAYRTSGWLAYVVADEATHGVVRMLGYWSRSAERQRIFRNRREAESWLEGQHLRVPAGFVREDLRDAC